MKTKCKDFGECHPLFCHACDRPAHMQHPFAPGVIEGPPTTESRGFPLVEIVLLAVCVSAVVAVVGFACGYFSLPGGLL